MKIDYAIHASDDNPLYLDFWPLVSKLWKLKFKVEPILLHFGETKVNTSSYGTVINMEILDNYNKVTQTQCSRYYYATTLKNKTAIISDIDMLPLSKIYFQEQIKHISNTSYIHLNSNLDHYPNIAACYHIAKGSTYEKVLGKYNSFEDYMKESTTYDNTWFSDEKFSTYKINEYKDKSIFSFLKRDLGQNGHRIDRPNWYYDESKLNENWYYDAHCPRPYSNYKNSIDRIIELALETY